MAEVLRKLHSLLFALEEAVVGREWEAALGNSLRLLGLIEGQMEEQQELTVGIKKQVLQHMDTARDRLQRKCEGPPLFSGTDLPVDIAKITKSQFYVRPGPPSAEALRTAEKPAERVQKGKRQLHPEVAGHASPYVAPSENGINENKTPENEPRKRGRFGDYSDVRKRASHPAENSKRNNSVPVCDISDDIEMEDRSSGFVTAKQKWVVDSVKKGGSRLTSFPPSSGGTGVGNTRTLGIPRRNVRSSFIPPIRGGAMAHNNPDDSMNESTMKCLELLAGPDGELPDKLRNLEPRLLEHISNEIMEKDSNVRWDDIAGLDYAKKCVTEMVIWPLLRPDLFHGCRSPEKGLLLFGPPGTGKTMIGKAIASEARATFFSISASSLTSKWIGEGEKLVRALFGVASCRQPAVIFIDEVDSLLSQRKSEGEHESSRRIKTQFLIEMEGIGSGNEQLLLIGATNRPQELDEAARRRFGKRLYIPLPSSDARAWIIRSLLKKDGLLSLSESDIQTICSATEGYSGSDMKNLVKEASMWPLREALREGVDISKINNEEMRPISASDFGTALQQVRPSVSKSELGTYEDWNRQFGSLALTSTT